MILVVGAGGEETYAEQFAQWADEWQTLATESNINFHRVGQGTNDQPSDSAGQLLNNETQNDKQRLEQLIEQHIAAGTEPLWIVMIGHGTFQQGLANFNLRGPDISAEQFATLLTPTDRPLILIQAFSSSGPWLPKLSGQGRIVITATRGGDEQNFSRFGKFLSAAISDPAADLDHDRNVSILEAFLKASADTSQFYETEGRLQTEHPLIDDNGDSLGTPPTFFRGVRVAQTAADDKTPDGQFALTMLTRRSDQTLQLSEEQKQQIAELDVQISELRKRKNELAEDDYFAQLEPLVLQLARVELGENATPPKQDEVSPETKSPTNADIETPPADGSEEAELP